MNSDPEDDEWLDEGLMAERAPEPPVMAGDDDAVLSLSAKEREQCRAVWRGFLAEEGLASVEVSPADGLMRVDFVNYTRRMLEALGLHPISRQDVAALLDRIGHPQQHAVSLDDLIDIMTLVKNDLKAEREKEIQEEVNAAIVAADAGWPTVGVITMQALQHSRAAQRELIASVASSKPDGVGASHGSGAGGIAAGRSTATAAGSSGGLLDSPTSTGLPPPASEGDADGAASPAPTHAPTALLEIESIATAMKLLRKRMIHKAEVKIPRRIKDMLSGYVFEESTDVLKTRYYKKWRRFMKIFSKGPGQRRDKNVLGSMKSRSDGGGGAADGRRGRDTLAASCTGESVCESHGVCVSPRDDAEQYHGRISPRSQGQGSPAFSAERGMVHSHSTSIVASAAFAGGGEGTEFAGTANTATLARSPDRASFISDFDGAPGSDVLTASSKEKIRRKDPWRAGSSNSHHAAALHGRLLANAGRAHKDLLYRHAIAKAKSNAQTDAYAAVNDLLRAGTRKFQELGQLLEKATAETMHEGIRMFDIEARMKNDAERERCRPALADEIVPPTTMEEEYVFTRDHLNESTARLRDVCADNRRLLEGVQLAREKNAASRRALTARGPAFRPPHTPRVEGNAHGGSFPRAFGKCKPPALGDVDPKARSLTPRQPRGRGGAHVRSYIALRGTR